MSVIQPLIRGAVVLPPLVNVIVTNGAGSMVVPAGYTKYTGEALGGGGAGFGSTTPTLRASGSGAQYAMSNNMIAVTPGNTIYWNVGVGGPPSDSWINYNVNAAPTSATTGALAKCGGSGTSGVAGANNTPGSVGATIIFGGNGLIDAGGNPTGGGSAGASGPGGVGTPGSGSNGVGGVGGIDTTGLSPSQLMGGGNGGIMGAGGLVPGGGGGSRTNNGVVGGGTGRVRFVFYP